MDNNYIKKVYEKRKEILKQLEGTATMRQCQEFCVIRIVDLTPFFQRKIFRVP